VNNKLDTLILTSVMN